MLLGMKMNKGQIRKIVADWKKICRGKLFAITGFTEEKPKEWNDFEDKPKYNRSPLYDVGDEVYVYVTKDIVDTPYSKGDLDRIKPEHLRVLCKGEVIGYYPLGYYIIVTEIFIRDNSVIGSIHSYHHGWTEDGDYLFEKIKRDLNGWRIA